MSRGFQPRTPADKRLQQSPAAGAARPASSILALKPASTQADYVQTTGSLLLLPNCVPSGFVSSFGVIQLAVFGG